MTKRVPQEDIEQALEALDALGSFLEEFLDANGEADHEQREEWDTVHTEALNALRVVDDQMGEL